MIDKEQIARINQLYHKQKAEGLTEDEKIEQSRLRRLYIDAVKNNLRGQLDNIKIVDKPSETDPHNINCGCGCHGHHHHDDHCKSDHHRH